MIRYKISSFNVQNKCITRPYKRISQCIAVLCIFSIVSIALFFLLTNNNGMVKISKIKETSIQKTRTFTGRKPKVYRTSDVDMDPLGIASPYYKMEIPANSSCRERKPGLSKQKLPMTALVSYPGSGSTWLRHLVQQLTGVATGSSICKKQLKKSKPFSVGECLSNNKVILVNSHDRYRRRKFEKKYDKLVVLYRDPFDTLRSTYTMKNPGHSESVDSEIFNVRGWYEFVRDHTGLYEQYYSDWMEAEKPLLLIYYDDLKNNLEATLKKLALFFEWRVSKKDVKCTLMTSEGHFHRRHVHNITNSEIFVGKLWHKLQDAEIGIAEIVNERRRAGHILESGDRLMKVLMKAKEEAKEDTSL